MAEETAPRALDAEEVAQRRGSGYPAGLREAFAGRAKRALGDAFGLTDFGVNLVELPPGTASSLRHWHSAEDELVYVLSGELVLITETGEQALRPGMVAGFPAGRPDGHQLVNRGEAPATFLEVGSRRPGDTASYPDDDLHFADRGRGGRFTRRDGTPYEA